MDVTLGDIIRAAQRIAPFLPPTPLEELPQLGERIYAKLENANKTHSFKIRGALNAILSLPAAQRERHIIAASSGNHAGAVAYAARLTGATAQILMPISTPRVKIDKVRGYGAQAILFGDTYDEAEAEALRRAKEGRVWISPYNDRQVIAGAGTIGLEIAAALPDLARVVVPVSGGGLIAGIATAIKSMRPDIAVIGVNASSAPAMYNAFYETRLPQVWETLAEALSGEIEAGAITLPLARRCVDEMVLVSEEQIAQAMRFMLAQGWVVEGGGAVAVAALLGDVIPRDGRVTAALISGGNVDLQALQRAAFPPAPGPHRYFDCRGVTL